MSENENPIANKPEDVTDNNDEKKLARSKQSIENSDLANCSDLNEADNKIQHADADNSEKVVQQVRPIETNSNQSSSSLSDSHSSSSTESKFYSISQDYWASQPATVNGMLGGYDYVNDPDVQQSQMFLDQFLSV